jgi:hypothetical protein
MQAAPDRARRAKTFQRLAASLPTSETRAVSQCNAFNLVEPDRSPADDIGHFTTLYHRQHAQNAMLGYSQNRSRGRGSVQRLTASLLHTRGRPAVFLDTATKVANMRAAYYRAGRGTGRAACWRAANPRTGTRRGARPVANVGREPVGLAGATRQVRQ